MIDKNFEQQVNEKRGIEAAKLLLDDLENTMRKVPELLFHTSILGLGIKTSIKQKSTGYTRAIF